MDVQSSSHWTDNEEVLERFVLGQIDPQAKRVLEEHLDTCAKCREAVSRETELAAGIRHLGRQELKARLRRRLSTTMRPSVPWPHVISAAAVLVIAMGVALYTFWTPLETWYEENLTHTLPQAADTTEVSAVDRETDKDLAAGDDVLGRNEALMEKIDRAKGEDRKIVEAPAVADQAAEEEIDVYREDKVFAASGAATETSVWIQGVIVPFAKDEEGERAGALEEPDHRAADQIRARPADAQKTRRAEGAPMPQAVTAELHQQPFRALPAEKQQLQMAQMQRTVETLVERTAEGLRMTFYPDSPIPEEELRAAQVQAVTEDSLLIVMPTQQIAYKIPPALGTVQAIQLKTK